MNDVHGLLERSAQKLAEALGLDSLRIRQILATRVEGRSAGLTPEQVAADLDLANSVLFRELSDARKHVGTERALELCERTDLGRLFLRHIYVQDWSSPDPLLYTVPELAAHLADLRKHLVRNREHLLATGYPVVTPPEAFCLLSSPWWHRFGMLYPTKIPVGQSGTIDSSKTTRSSFVWSRKQGRRFRTLEDAGPGATPPVNPEETCDYDAAPPVEGMSPQDAARLAVLRPKVLELETQVLAALERVLTDGKGAEAWETCVPILTGSGTSEDLRLSGHDVDFLIRMDRFYGCEGESSISSAGTIVATVPGAFSLIILLICFCEWVATSGVTRRIRDALGAAGLIEEKPLRPPRLSIRSQYQIARTPAEEALDRAIGLHRAAAKEADDFFQAFFRRVNRVLEHEVRVPVGIEMWVPRGAEKDARGVLQVFSAAQENHLEQFGHPMPLSLGGAAGADTDGPGGGELHAPGRSGTVDGRNIFRRARHGTWSFEFAEKSITTDKGPKGLTTIAYLLRNADTDCPVMNLAAVSASGASPAGPRPRGMNEAVLSAEGLSIGSSGDSGNVLDEKAVCEYRERRRTILRELDEAEHDSDVARIPKLKAELAALTTEVTRAIGLGDRRRKVGHPLERARKTVGKQINVGLEFIKERHPELYVHLRTRLDYALYVWVYRSVPGITWDT